MILSILIPALNEEKTISTVISRIPKKIEQIEKINIIVVDDGSTDKTSKIAKENGAIVIKHKKNLGLGNSFRDGLDKAIKLQSEILVTIDADNQFSPEEIPKLIKPLLDGKADFTSGSRFLDKKITPKNMPKIKKWGNVFLAKLLSKITGEKLTDVSCGFRAYSKEAMLRLNLFGKFTYTQETLLELSYKQLTLSEVPITVRYFDERKSRIAHSILNYAFKSSNIIIRTIKDYRPLKFFGYCGIFIFLIGLLMDILVFKHFLETGSFSPYKIFGFMGAFFNAVGITIFFIGILADIIDKVRLTQEKIIYLEKQKYYQKK